MRNVITAIIFFTWFLGFPIFFIFVWDWGNQPVWAGIALYVVGYLVVPVGLVYLLDPWTRNKSKMECEQNNNEEINKQ